MAARLNRGIGGHIRGGVVTVLVGLIRAYQLAISPWLGPRCRFDPTCSEYAADSIRRFGPVRGSWLAFRRVARCHPWGGSGYDPVPEEPKENGTAT